MKPQSLLPPPPTPIPGEPMNQYWARVHAWFIELHSALESALPKKKKAQPKKEVAPKGALDSLAKFSELLSGVTQETQREWINQYGLAHVTQELNNASLWLRESRVHRPRMGVFLTSWLKRSAPKKTTTLLFGRTFE